MGAHHLIFGENRSFWWKEWGKTCGPPHWRTRSLSGKTFGPPHWAAALGRLWTALTSAPRTRCSAGSYSYYITYNILCIMQYAVMKILYISSGRVTGYYI